MSPDAGSANLIDVQRWAMGEARFLSPTQAHLLLFLSLNAWTHIDNPEGRPVGAVLSGKTAIKQIRMGTSLGRTAVLDGLESLQSMAYLYTDLKPGNGVNEIRVLWGSEWADLREEMRAGVSELPAALRKQKKTSKVAEPVENAVVLAFPLVRETDHH